MSKSIVILSILFFAVSVYAAPLVIDGSAPVTFNTSSASYYSIAPGAAVTKINFQPTQLVLDTTGVIPPTGWPNDWYLDYGLAYGDPNSQGINHGLTGTDSIPANMSFSTKYSNGESENEFIECTTLGLEGGNVWNLEIANGFYVVKLCVADRSNDRTFNDIDVEGVVLSDNDDDRVDIHEFAVEVTDGNITIDNLDTGDDEPKLAYIEITEAVAGGGGVLEDTMYDAKKAVFTFAEGIEFQSTADVTIAGDNAIEIVATTGDIIVDTEFDLSGGQGANGNAGKAGPGGWAGGEEDGSGEGPGAGLRDGSRTGAGGSYGGDGGRGGHDEGGTILGAYGWEEMYVLLGGSGGCGGNDAGGGGGGGAIALVAFDGDITIGVNGLINVDGGTVIAPDYDKSNSEDRYLNWIAKGYPASTSPPFSDDGWSRYGGGGGSGGAILLDAFFGAVTVDGILSANGGEGANSNNDWDGAGHEGSGGGGGGRIAIYSSTGGYNGSGAVSVLGGLNGSSLDPNFMHSSAADDTDETMEIAKGRPKVDADSEPGDDGTIYTGSAPPPGPWCLYPASQQSDVSIFTHLSWIPSIIAVTQDVYFDGELVESGDETLGRIENSQLGGPLEGNTEYTWIIVTNGINTEWSFTTGNAEVTSHIPCDQTAASPDSLKWTGIPGAASYTVYFSNLYGNVVSGTDPCTVTGTEVSLPYALVDGTQYFWRVDVNGPNGELIVGDVVTFMQSPLTSIKINFQPENAEVPEGYMKDYGQLYGVMAQGQIHGWDEDISDELREREANVDKRYDTMIIVNGETWELALPADVYTVDLYAGDAVDGYGDNNAFIVEGIYFPDPTPGENTFDEYTLAVPVYDGNLTITNADGPSKVCFIHISSSDVALPVVTGPADGTDIYSPMITFEPIDDPSYDRHDVYFSSDPDNFGPPIGTITRGVDPNVISCGQTLDIETDYFCKVVGWSTTNPTLDQIASFVYSFETRGPICSVDKMGDISGPDGEPDCHVNIYDLQVLLEDWLVDNIWVEP